MSYHISPVSSYLVIRLEFQCEAKWQRHMPYVQRYYLSQVTLVIGQVFQYMRLISRAIYNMH